MYVTESFQVEEKCNLLNIALETYREQRPIKTGLPGGTEIQVALVTGVSPGTWGYWEGRGIRQANTPPPLI